MIVVISDTKTTQNQSKTSQFNQTGQMNGKITRNLNEGSKTPQEIFQYKIKSSKAGAKKNGNPFMNAQNAKNMQHQQQIINSRHTIGYYHVGNNKKNGGQSQQQVNSTKPPKNQKKDQLLSKSDSIDVLQKPSTKKDLNVIIDNNQESGPDIDNVQINFLYSTQQFPAGPLTNKLTTQTIEGPFSAGKNYQDSPAAILNTNQYQQSKTSTIQPQLLWDTEDFRDSKQAIRVLARFRPLNTVEHEIRQIHQKKEEIVQFFEDQSTVKIKEEFYTHSSNLTFTFDHVFKPTSTQADVFNMVGKQTIDDIMNGFNGTVFAYGQTGSGKTYTMYGQDLFDEDLMGIVPRAAKQIFDHIKNQDLEIEYQIRLQMVEIYKEQLRDLLYDNPDHLRELKIKEDPKRGTYVEGLTEVCIVSEEEIMAVICAGETMRHVASTNLNQVSSRSHSICIIEIVQKFPNDSEKRGILNLVDLAGSERVSKSHAQGEALEEAKKINFSLSMLGKVINCLTKNAPFIPYRDSKLTRLLKESLGGNNKTSLIVACSMHHSNVDETVSSLRFAQSAKFIQNKIKMNIKSSPEHLQMIIDQLKIELRTAKEEICRLRLGSTNQNSRPLSNNSYEQFKHEDQEVFKICNDVEIQNQIEIHNASRTNDQDSQTKNSLHQRPHQSILAKNYDVIETNNNQKMQMLSLLSEFSSILSGTGTPNFISPMKGYEVRLLHLMRVNEDLCMKIQSKERDIDSLKNDKDELQSKVKSLEDKIINYKQKMVVLEKKLSEFESEKDQMYVNEVKQTYKIEDYQSQIEVLTQQVKCMEKALEDSDMNCQNLLKDKLHLYQKSFKDYMNDQLKINRIQVSSALDYFINKHSFNTASTCLFKQSFISQLDLMQHYENQSKILVNSESIVPLQDQDLLSQNLYSLELINAVEEGSVPPELTIYLLKQLLIDASLANHNLQRMIALNKWRQIMEFGKHKVKSELCKVQESTIQTLESLLEKQRSTHDRLRARVDKLENHLYDNRNYYADIILMTEGNQLPDNGGKIMRTRESKNNLSLISNNQIYGNNMQKSRFIRTVTTKTLGKAFNFNEKSPMSRASLGAANQSILTQAYNQKHQAVQQYLQTQPGNNGKFTPLRTGAMNSPTGAIYNFQSPVRKGLFSAAQNLNANNYNGKGQNQGNKQVNQPQIITQMGMNANEQLNFEEAINKFFNSNENDEKAQSKIKELLDSQSKVQQEMFMTLEDLQKIESIDNPQEIKDYIKSRFERQHQERLHNISNSAIIHHNALFQQYQQNNALHQQQISSSSSNNLQSSHAENPQQINSHTTNNNLYAQSNDYYLDMNQENATMTAGKNFSGLGPEVYGGTFGINPHPANGTNATSDNLHQRQEHVMTMASEYLITSNSVIGPNMFGNGLLGNNQYYQNDYMDRLQEKIVHIQEEVETQKCRAEEHKRAYYESKRQIEQMRTLMEEKENIHHNILKREIMQWENAVNKLKEMNEIELQKKQREIEKLHQILAQWIESYQSLEHSKGGVTPKPKELEDLIKETLRHRRNRSIPISDHMTVTTKNSNSALNFNQQRPQMKSAQVKLLPTALMSQSVIPPPFVDSAHLTSGSNIIVATLNTNNIYVQGSSAPLKKFDKKRFIKGDTSPCIQEESYIMDLDLSRVDVPVGVDINHAPTNTHAQLQTEEDFESIKLETYETQGCEFQM